MRQVIIIGLIWLFAGCSVEKHVPGKYMAHKNPDYLQLKKDSTFIYEFRAFHLYQQSSGTWKKISKNLIVLNSYIKSTSIPLDVSITKTKEHSSFLSIDLSVIGSHPLSDYSCVIFVNNKSFCTKRCDSLWKVPLDQPVKDIYFQFFREPQRPLTSSISFPLTTTIYHLREDNESHIQVKIQFKDSYFYYRSFDNDTLKIVNDGIKLHHADSQKWKKLKKVSDGTNLFAGYSDTSTVIRPFP